VRPLRVLLGVIAASALVPAALAESVKPPTLSGRVYAYYRYELTSKAASSDEGANAFDVTRCYVNIKGGLTPKLYYRVTTDVGRETTYSYELEEAPQNTVPETYRYNLVEHKSKGKFDFYLKYAYIDVRDVLPAHEIYAGLEQLPWAGYEEEIWSWRAIRRVALDDWKWRTTTDLGVGVKGTLGEGLVEHHLTFTNGAGYKSPEDGTSGKAITYRLSVFPLVSSDAFKGLSVNAYVKADNLGEKVAAGEAKNPDIQYGGLVGLKHDFVNFGAGYFMRSEGEDNTAVTPPTSKVEGNLITAYATGHFRATEGMTINPLVRYDALEPDKDTSDDERTLLIGGVGFKFFDGALALIPNYQTESYKTVDPVSGATENKSTDYVYLHCSWDWK